MRRETSRPPSWLFFPDSAFGPRLALTAVLSDRDCAVIIRLIVQPKPPTARMDVRAAAVLCIISTGFLFVGLDRYGIVNVDEIIYHAIAERMAETGNWLYLDFRGCQVRVPVRRIMGFPVYPYR